MTEATDELPVGEQLARARAALGLSVADIAHSLKFAPRQIEALERGRFEELPAGTFARGMLRGYARVVKLDPAPLLERIAARVAAPDNAEAVASARRSIPISDGARRTNLAYVGLSVALLAVAAAIALEWRQERRSAARMSFVPAAQAPIEASRAPAAAAAPQLGPQASLAETPPQAAPEASPARRIVLRFGRESWVQVRDRADRVLVSSLHPAGSERVVEGEPPFRLVIGNAQHVQVLYDDQPVDLAPYVKVEVARFTLE